MKIYAHTPDACPSNHHNDGDDVCTDCGADLNSGEAFAYPSPGDTVKTEDGAAVVDSLDTSRGPDFAPLVILDLGEETRRTEAAFLIRTGPSSWRERLPRAGTTGGAAPHQVLEVGDVFHGAPLPTEPLRMYWSPDLSQMPGGACLVIDVQPGHEQALVLDVLFYDRAQQDALRPVIMEAAQRIMMQPTAPVTDRQVLSDLLDADEIATILAALRYYQENGQGDPDNRSDAIHMIATSDDGVISLDADAIDGLCERINLDAAPARELRGHIDLPARLRADAYVFGNTGDTEQAKECLAKARDLELARLIEEGANWQTVYNVFADKLKEENPANDAFRDAVDDDGGNVNVDDNAVVSDSEKGAYVHSWIWVSNADAGITTEGEG